MRFIGCKTLLLGNIKQIIDEKAPEARNFCDMFSGTATVGRYFKQWYKVYSNDLLYFSYVLQRGTIENKRIPSFEKLKRIKNINDPIKYFNELDLKEMECISQEKRFFQNTYSPIGGRMYLNDENALNIDFVRNTVENWKDEGILSDDEYFYLIACIIEGIPYVSNISGTYGAFHKKWDKRSYKKYKLFRLDVIENNKKNKCFNLDAMDLIKKIDGDILYIDPPYNNRQYLSNYHVLETAAKYDFPKVKGITAQRVDKNKKSVFCMKNKAISAFEKLISEAKFRHIILSYSTDGLMSIKDIEDIMRTYGISDSFELYKIPYRRYKSKKSTKTDELNELLIYVRKGVY
ncbi:DNA adenine methylase [Megamonas funiformis]|uniref:DNA adenine methylase n=1 Tax=Megamonas funiformis TaxID=437897 RepID=UPI001959C6C0|nr:DNA adenine methylase [Megamonas funiformis]MBM6725696.1 DNA adenine methylase [Megamonas funiformis]